MCQTRRFHGASVEVLHTFESTKCPLTHHTSQRDVTVTMMRLGLKPLACTIQFVCNTVFSIESQGTGQWIKLLI